MTKVFGEELYKLMSINNEARTDYIWIDPENDEVKFIKWSKKVFYQGAINISMPIRKAFGVFGKERNEVIGIEVTLKLIRHKEEKEK